MVLAYMVTSSKTNLEKKDQSGPDRKTNLDRTLISLINAAVYVNLMEDWKHMLRVHVSLLLSIWNNHCILFDRMKNLDGYVHNLKKRQILHARRRRKMETPKSIKVC